MKAHTIAMFPGLGCEYPGMLHSFLNIYPEYKAFAEKWLGKPLFNSLINFDSNNFQSKEKELNIQKLIHLVNLLHWELESNQNPEYSLVMGHSLGFYAAAVASGAISPEDSFYLIESVYRVCWEYVPNPENKVIALSLKRTIHMEEFDRFKLELISENSPNHVVLYGSPSHWKSFLTEYSNNIFKMFAMETKLPFHSRSLELTANALEKLTSTLSYKPITTAAYSHTRLKFLPGFSEVLAEVVKQVALPVKWKESLMHLSKNGSPSFQEIGAGKILTKMLRWNKKLLAPTISQALKAEEVV